MNTHQTTLGCVCLMALALVSCQEADPQQRLSCSPEDRVEYADTRICTYPSDLIIETGFECPEGMHAYQNEAVAICAEDELSEEEVEGVENLAERPQAATYTQDIRPLLHANCVGCHRFAGASFPLETYAQVAERADEIAQAVAERTMPPWGVDNSGACGTFVDTPWLSFAEITTFSAWAGSGALEGPEEEAPEAANPFAPLDRVDLSLNTGEPFEPQGVGEEVHRCYLLDPGLLEDAFVRAYTIRPSEATIVRTATAHIVGPEDVALLEELDAGEGGAGWLCADTLERLNDSDTLAGWASGAPPIHFPEGLGVRLPATHKILMEVRMVQNEEGLSATTTLDLQLSETVDTEVGFSGFLDADLRIPGGRERIEAFSEFLVSDKLEAEEVTLWGIVGFMNDMGRDLHVEILPLEGAEACLLDQPLYTRAFHKVHYLSEPVVVRGDDLVRITCGYDTTGTGVDIVTGGFGEGQEVCGVAFFIER